MPSTEAIAHMKIPVEFPNVTSSASRRPWTASERTTSAVAGPGVRLTSTAIPAKLTSVSSMGPSLTLELDRLADRLLVARGVRDHRRDEELHRAFALELLLRLLRELQDHAVGA